MTSPLLLAKCLTVYVLTESGNSALLRCFVDPVKTKENSKENPRTIQAQLTALNMQMRHMLLRLKSRHEGLRGGSCDCRGNLKISSHKHALLINNNETIREMGGRGICFSSNME